MLEFQIPNISSEKKGDNRKTFTIAGSIKVPGMIGGGHHIAVDSKGNIYIAQTTMGLQKLRRKSS